jgi:glutamate synthase domain-containing protein 1
MRQKRETGQGLFSPEREYDACGIGMVVNIRGERSHRVVEQALTVLENLTHRGARGAEPNTGDGAGILLQLPHAFLQRKANGKGFSLPEPGQYGVGMVFLPPDPTHRRLCELHFESIVASEGQRVIGWRSVRINKETDLGPAARRAEPKIRQVFIARNGTIWCIVECGARRWNASWLRITSRNSQGASARRLAKVHVRWACMVPP